MHEGTLSCGTELRPLTESLSTGGPLKTWLHLSAVPDYLTETLPETRKIPTQYLKIHRNDKL